MSMQTAQAMREVLNGTAPAGTTPLWELEFHLWNAFSETPVIVGTEFVKLTPGKQARALSANAEAMVAVADRLGFGAVSLPGGYWESAPGHPAYYWLPPDARMQQIRLVKKASAGAFLLTASSGGVMCMPGANDYLDFSYRLFDDPESIDTQARDTLASGLEQARILRDVGADILFTASDIADNHGVFFNPEQMERFILPYLRDWAEGIRALGGFSIMHSDGNLTAVLDALADSGIHALQAIDPVAGMDMRAAQACVNGRMALVGNIDCGLLLTGTPEAVYGATRKLLADCAGMRLILGVSNAVQPDVPKDNYQALAQARLDHDREAEPVAERTGP